MKAYDITRPAFNQLALNGLPECADWRFHYEERTYWPVASTFMLVVKDADGAELLRLRRACWFLPIRSRREDLAALTIVELIHSVGCAIQLAIGLHRLPLSFERRP